MPDIDANRELQPQLLDPEGPVCLIIKARLRPVGDLDRFQPSGFPEIGHVIYDAPRDHGRTEKVCIVDSPAGMANHLEAVCVRDSGSGLHPELAGMPYVRCVTDRKTRVENGTVILDPKDPRDRVVVTSLTEGHRIASDYFLDAALGTHGRNFREVLRESFGIIEVKKDKTYFIPPETWWSIYQTIFTYDPNSLVHGVLFAREQIKISRFLSAHHEAIGAARVGRSGVKFNRLGETKSGQPIFSVDEETAQKIRATFILDLALLRSYGRNDSGLNDAQKRLVLDLALWKVQQLLAHPFRYRTQCFLQSDGMTLSTESQPEVATKLSSINVTDSITACRFPKEAVTDVYYPADQLFKPGKEEKEQKPGEDEVEDSEESDEA